MSALHNPFVLFGYAGEEYFCDREKETQELISALRNGRNYCLRTLYGHLASTAVKTLSFFRCTPSGVQFFIKNADLYDLRMKLYDLRMLFQKKSSTFVR